jgi:AcrR family transcriptional regulator
MAARSTGNGRRITKVVRGSKSGASPPEERLSEERVVEAALTIIREQGVQGLSTRALAAELGVTQAAPYYYVRNKEELFTFVIDAVLASVKVPEPDAGPWDARLARLMNDIIETVAQYPGLGEVMVNSPTPPRCYDSCARKSTSCVRPVFRSRMRCSRSR